MANPNIAATASIYGRTDVLVVGTSPAAITSNASGSNAVYKINMLVVSNVNGSSNVDVNVDLYRSSTPYRIANTISVPADASIVIIGKDNPMYLLEGDSLRVTASSAGYAEAVCSYEEIG